jgi:hypothetical protein
VKKQTKRLEKLQLRRELLRDLELAGAVGGTATGHDISFRYTGCLTLCNTTA